MGCCSVVSTGLPPVLLDSKTIEFELTAAILGFIVNVQYLSGWADMSSRVMNHLATN